LKTKGNYSVRFFQRERCGTGICGIRVGGLVEPHGSEFPWRRKENVQWRTCTSIRTLGSWVGIVAPWVGSDHSLNSGQQPLHPRYEAFVAPG
jgi:hypothetical protein